MDGSIDDAVAVAMADSSGGTMPVGRTGYLEEQDDLTAPSAIMPLPQPSNGKPLTFSDQEF